MLLGTYEIEKCPNCDMPNSACVKRKHHFHLFDCGSMWVNGTVVQSTACVTICELRRQVKELKGTKVQDEE